MAMDKLTAFNTATELVAPIVDAHGLQDISVGPPFGTSFKTSKVEQHVNEIIRIADWLLDKED